MPDNSNVAVNTTGGLLSFEKELICSICTEVLYTPLTILNCLHTFCASCLKEWFYHQHRKASSSRSSSSVANPYSCPTCRSEVRDVQHNATVSNLLELFLAANPDRDRTQQDKDDMDKMYKSDGTRPGDKILPKVERRRERRHRRDEGDVAARERQMIEEARQRSLRDFDSPSSATALVPPRSDHDRTRSASADREERRQRRRERERHREQTNLTIPGSSHPAHSQEEEADRHNASPPVSSPRHPDAVEARQREQRMSHQASLRSLVSASENGTGTGDTLDEARIMQEILDEGLLGEIDVDALTEAEQDLLAERIAELYRQRHPRSGRSSNVHVPTQSPSLHTTEVPSHSSIHITSAPRRRSSSRSRSATNEVPMREPDTRTRSHSSRPPQAPVNTMMRSNSSSSVTINHRRRTSEQSRNYQRPTGSRQSSVERNPVSSAAASHAESHSEPPNSRESRPSITGGRTNTDPASPPRVSEAWLQAGGEDRRLQPRNAHSPARSPRHTQTMPIENSSAQPANSPRLGQAFVVELDSTTANVNKPQTTQYNEPSVACFRCEKVDIQYEIHRHCQSCNVDLCMRCYREGRGCKHWYGFGHMAEENFEASKTRNDTTEPPHLLIGRQYCRPAEVAILNSRTSPRTQEIIPCITRSDPKSRLREGHFCDRCGNFANSQFWLCDFCNDGEWGFCKSCVQEHKCCTHPLLPVAYVPQSQAQAQQSLTHDLATLNLRNQPPRTPLQPRPLSLSALPPTAMIQSNSRPLTPTSITSSTGRPRSHPGYGYDYLSINVDCDMCHNIIFPSAPRYHCPTHASDYDICTSCYASFLVQSRMRRTQDPSNTAEMIAGWRKCPLGHRMIVLAFEADDEDGAMRRVVKNDLVGGRKMNDSDISAWNAQHNLHVSAASPPTSPPLVARGTWIWKENADGTRKTRSRTSTLTGGGAAAGTSFAGSNAGTLRFPPDGGFGSRGSAVYPYWPEEGEGGAGELVLPRGAEVTEMEDINGDWWSGVFAGDVGVFPGGYVREGV
ncbi:hypothetical protein ES702_00179 [subsurface metagenome]